MYSRSQGGPSGRRASKSSFVPGRFPPMQTEARDPADPAARGIDEATRQSALRISVSDHTVIKNRLDEFSAVLPNDFAHIDQILGRIYQRTPRASALPSSANIFTCRGRSRVVACYPCRGGPISL
ncbi:hypothetical protein LB505_006328 [Fusarium chuoi]|nr:hypothetical protein LB505_006328 [Fusarium chuoi]